MNLFACVVIFFAMAFGVYQVTPLVADHYKSVAAKAMANKYELEKKQRLTIACETGKTSHIIYNGKTCKVL